MKTRSQILDDLQTDTVANTSLLTFFGLSSVIRAIHSAISYVFCEIWYDLFQADRNAHVQTAVGDSLVTEAGREGTIKRGATNSSVVLVLNGTAGIDIPQGTIIKSNVNGAQYQTCNDLVLGQNPTLQRPLYSNILGDIVLAESVKTGSGTKVNAGELTIFATPIAGVTVTNLVPSVGGEDGETDEEFRARILSTVSILNQGTQAFYKQLCTQANDNVLQTLAVFNPANNGVNLYVVKRSLATFTDTERQAIATYVYPLQRALQPITVYNAQIQTIDIEAYLEIATGFTSGTVNANLAVAISNVINNSVYGFKSTIAYYDLLVAVTAVPGIKSISTFLVNNAKDDVLCGTFAVPQFTTLNYHDQNSDETTAIQVNYIILE
jgi:uncharacterized phage protein gp47/JayE